MIHMDSHIIKDRIDETAYTKVGAADAGLTGGLARVRRSRVRCFLFGKRMKKGDGLVRLWSGSNCGGGCVDGVSIARGDGTMRD